VNKIFFLLVTTALLLSCSANEVPNGHWVSIEYFGGKPYQTLDFVGDTALLINARCIPCNEGELFLVKRENDSVEYAYGYEYSEVFFIGNDTIVRPARSWDSRNLEFVRFNPKELDNGDLFSSLDVVINLAPTEKIQTDQFRRKSLLADIAVGKIRDSYYENKRSIDAAKNRISVDSFLIQVDDVFISADSLPIWVRAQQDLLAESERGSLMVRMSLDKDTPSGLRQTIINKIRSTGDSIRIFESFYNSKIGEPIFLPTKR
jgi:hypothetical protein